jgi:hypothetical protein
LKFNQNGGQNGGNHSNFQKNMSNDAYCTYCSLPGHVKSNCSKLKNKFKRDSGTSNNDCLGHKDFHSNDVAFTTTAMKNIFSSDMWILDSGASCDYCGSVEGLMDVKEMVIQ